MSDHDWMRDVLLSMAMHAETSGLDSVCTHLNSAVVELISVGAFERVSLPTSSVPNDVIDLDSRRSALAGSCHSNTIGIG